MILREIACSRLTTLSRFPEQVMLLLFLLFGLLAVAGAQAPRA